MSIIILLFVIYNPSSEKTLAQTASQLTNGTNALTNGTNALTNATSALNNATKAIQNISSSISATSGPPATTNATSVNTTKIVTSFLDSSLPAVFIIVIFLIIIIPLVLDMYLAYTRKPKDTTDKENYRIAGMPGLYRALMTFGVIVLVGTVIFYLLFLITININNSGSPILQSLIDILKNLGTILGTALATIIAFYFGMRGAESAAEKATAAATKQATEKEQPNVLNTLPADGAKDVPLNSLVTATFSEPMSSSTITSSTFKVKKEGEATTIPGTVSLGPDSKTATFDAVPDFEPNTKYIATIDMGAKDLAGNTLASAKTWSFSTKNS